MKSANLIKNFFRSGILRSLTVVILILLSYGNIFNNQYVFDDFDFIKNWPISQSLNGVLPSLMGAYPHSGKYRPIKMVIMTINYVLWQDNVFLYHLQSVLIHTIATFLVYKITARLSNGRNVPFLATLFFAAHPVHTESITFMTASTEMWGIVFMLLSFYLYILFSKQKPEREGIINYRLSILFAVLSYYTYEMTLVLPLILLLHEATFVGFRKNQMNKLITKMSPFWVGVFVYLSIRFGVLGIYSSKQYLLNNFYLTLLAMSKSLLKYLELLIFPVNLSIIHSLHGIPSFYSIDLNREASISQSILDWETLSVLIICLFTTSFIIKKARKYPLLCFSLGLMFISLLPVSNIYPLGVLMGERYLYLSSAGFCIILSYLVDKLSVWFVWLPRFFPASVVLGLVCLYVFTTYSRNLEWKNQIVFWSVTKEKYPSSAMATHNLGYAFYQEGEVNKAVNYYLEVLALEHNDYVNIHRDLARAYEDLGNTKLAEQEYSTATALQKQKTLK